MRKESTRELLLEDIRGNKEVAYALLGAKQDEFVDEVLTFHEEHITLESQFTEDMYDWQVVKNMLIEEKLRHLINCGQLYDQLKDTIYTYRLEPKQLVFTVNGLPKLMHKGIKEQVFPYEAISEETFLNMYQSMIVSLLDVKTKYEALANGKLPFYKGDLFCESIVRATSIADILQLLQEKYEKEKRIRKEQYTVVKNRLLSGWKIATSVTSVMTALLLVVISYLMLFALPNQQAISEIRLAFIQKDYSRVITTAKTKDSKALSQEDKYLVAYSVIMSEPLTDEQKKELSRISIQTNEEYLRYWVLIGQSKIDEAIDIASFLDDPQLLMYGLTKKIDEVQRDSHLKAEERTEKINQYKSKLDELKKKYLDVSNDSGQQSNRPSNNQDSQSTTSSNNQ